MLASGVGALPRAIVTTFSHFYIRGKSSLTSQRYVRLYCAHYRNFFNEYYHRRVTPVTQSCSASLFSYRILPGQRARYLSLVRRDCPLGRTSPAESHLPRASVRKSVSGPSRIRHLVSCRRATDPGSFNLFMGVREIHGVVCLRVWRVTVLETNKHNKNNAHRGSVFILQFALNSSERRELTQQVCALLEPMPMCV